MRLALVDVKGLTPAVDPTQSGEAFALSGRNYVFDSLGVKSPFGDRYVSPVELTKPDHAQGFRLRLKGGDRCFHFFAYGIMEWDESTGGWQTIFATPDTTLVPYRWTFEYLNGYLYFAHPSAGLIVLNLSTGRADPHSKVADVTIPGVIAISQSNGRLGVLTTDSLYWSAPSNGLKFTPELGGAGAQVLAARVAGDPIMLTSYARGLLTWTTGGVLRSEFTGDSSVFRHRTLNTEYRPINSFCTARVDVDTSIILDERGLFRSRGEVMEPYAPIFNEFLIDFLQRNKFRTGANIRIEWDDRQRFLYMSYSSSYADSIYEKCFVYYPPLDKWGEFNELHYGIVPVIITNSERADDNFGFVDSDARLRYFARTGSREQRVEEADSPATGNLYIPEIQKPTQYNLGDDWTWVSSTAKARGFDATGLSQPENYYVSGSQAPIEPELRGLNAIVQIGLIRAQGSQSHDQMSEIVSCMIRNVKSGEANQLATDFNLIPDGTANEDFNVGSGLEDKGLDPLNYINHGLRIIGTIDGETEYDSEDMTLVRFDKASRQYVGSINGIWHVIEFDAIEVGEMFHARTIEMTAIDSGRWL